MPAHASRKPVRREPVKVAAVVVLALVLGVALFRPAKDAAEVATAEPAANQLSTEPSGRPRDPQSMAAKAAEGGIAARHPIAETGAPRARLPRLEIQQIAAVDPFTAKGHLSDPLSDPLSDGFASPQNDSARVLASARAEIRAVYRNARGAVAIVDDQIIPVKDAKKWIESMRSADADP